MTQHSTLRAPNWHIPSGERVGGNPLRYRDISCAVVTTTFSRCSLCPPQHDFGRRTRVSFKEFPHELESGVIFLFRVRDCAISRQKQVKIAHVGVVRCEKDTKV